VVIDRFIDERISLRNKAASHSIRLFLRKAKCVHLCSIRLPHSIMLFLGMS